MNGMLHTRNKTEQLLRSRGIEYHIEQTQQAIGMKQDMIVIFDNECCLCESSVISIMRRDRKAKFKFAPAQSNTGIELQKGYGIHALNHQTIILIKDGTVYTKSDALIEIGSNLDGFWKMLSIVKIVPKLLRDWAYSKVAKNRYRWFGKKKSCTVLSKDEKSRFLD
jgi:predicted DCC family thiol-disulfide oxidoreductase YuxK